MGAALAGGKLGWEIVGIRDGFEGLLHPERYPDGGVVSLSPERVESLDPATAGVLGQAPAVDPFHSPAPGGADVDLSDEILKRLQAAHVDALVSAVGVPGLGDPRQAPPQGPPHGLHPPFHRERRRLDADGLRVQHAP